MQTIHKYSIPIDEDYAVLTLPKWAKLLHFGEQPGLNGPASTLQLWAEVDTDEKVIEKHMVYVVPTGRPIPNKGIGLKYHGTVQMQGFGAPFVLHLYVKPI